MQTRIKRTIASLAIGAAVFSGLAFSASSAAAQVIFATNNTVIQNNTQTTGQVVIGGVATDLATCAADGVPLCVALATPGPQPVTVNGWTIYL